MACICCDGSGVPLTEFMVASIRALQLAQLETMARKLKLEMKTLGANMDDDAFLRFASEGEG